MINFPILVYLEIRELSYIFIIIRLTSIGFSKIHGFRISEHDKVLGYRIYQASQKSLYSIMYPNSTSNETVIIDKIIFSLMI